MGIAPITKGFPPSHNLIDPRLERRRDREVVHGRSNDDGARCQQFVDRTIRDGEIFPLRRSQLRRFEVCSTPIIGEVREHGCGEVPRYDFASGVVLFFLHSITNFAVNCCVTELARASESICNTSLLTQSPTWKSVSPDAVRGFCGAQVSRSVVQAFSAGANDSDKLLSPRERQVLELIAEGKSMKEIGALLGVSSRTADSHRTKIMSKLGLHDTASLVRYAIRAGLVSPETP
jgi:DNA-binding CsgD family transcriptional regulator